MSKETGETLGKMMGGAGDSTEVIILILRDILSKTMRMIKHAIRRRVTPSRAAPIRQ